MEPLSQHLRLSLSLLSSSSSSLLVFSSSLKHQPVEQHPTDIDNPTTIYISTPLLQDDSVKVEEELKQPLWKVNHF